MKRTIHQNRIELLRQLRSLWASYGRVDYRRAYQSILRDHAHNVAWSTENPLQVSYATKPDHRWDNERRVRTSLGRYLRRIVKVTCPDDVLDQYVSELLALHANSPKGDKAFQLLEGTEITKAYRNAVGGSSCMTGDDCEYVQMYANNPEVCKLLVYVPNGKPVARRLIWETTDNETVADRTYPNNGQFADIMDEYCKQQGWILRTHNRYPDKYPQLSDQSERTVCVNWSTENLIPYLDTFRWGREYEYKLYLSNFDDCSEFLCDSTSGSVTWCGYTCELCNERTNEDDGRYIGDYFYCDHCVSHNFTYSEIENEYIPDDDVVTLADGNVVSITWAQNNAMFCECCERYFSDEDGTYHNDQYWCDDCFSDNYGYCSNCGEITPHDDLEDSLCPDCYDSRETETDEVERVAE